MTERPRHVVLVGIDGVRWDVLQDVTTANLDRVAVAGFIAPLQINPSGRSISGPSWATMFTGVLPPDHNIHNNDFTDHRLAQHPDVITTATRHRPELQSYAGADWLPLVAVESGGPLLASGGFVPDRNRGADATPTDWYDADQQVTDRAVAALGEFNSAPGSLSFVYLHAVDIAGHKLGVGAGYREAVEESDRRLGEVLDAIETRPSRADEDWLVIVATDHGHRDEGGHGEDSVEERTAWISASGPSVPTLGGAATTADLQLEQADVAGHIHHVLGIPVVSDAFVGQPFGTRSAAADSLSTADRPSAAR